MILASPGDELCRLRDMGWKRTTLFLPEVAGLNATDWPKKLLEERDCDILSNLLIVSTV